MQHAECSVYSVPRDAASWRPYYLVVSLYVMSMCSSVVCNVHDAPCGVCVASFDVRC